MEQRPLFLKGVVTAVIIELVMMIIVIVTI